MQESTSSYLAPFLCQASNSGCQAWHLATVPGEQSSWPSSDSLSLFFFKIKSAKAREMAWQSQAYTLVKALRVSFQHLLGGSPSCNFKSRGSNAHSLQGLPHSCAYSESRIKYL